MEQTYKVIGIDVRDNEHLKNDTKAKILAEFENMFNRTWISNPQGDVTYTFSIEADDNNDTLVEKTVNKVKDTVGAGLKAVTPAPSVATREDVKKAPVKK